MFQIIFGGIGLLTLIIAGCAAEEDIRTQKNDIRDLKKDLVTADEENKYLCSVKQEMLSEKDNMLNLLNERNTNA